MFQKYSNYKEMAKLLLPRSEYKPFPKYADREAWDNIHPSIRKIYLSESFKKKILEYESPALCATKYLEFQRSGGKDQHWTSVTQGRRDYLFDAVIAECIEGKGEYIDKIIDILWAICEETSWIIPQHINHMHNHMFTGIIKLGLPDITETNFIDLYGAICAGVLGWTYYFLKDRLDEESPILCRRIEYELNRKIIIPFMTHDDLTWFGFHGHKINNWNPWILESIVPACLTVIKDEEYRIEFMARVLEKFDIYVDYCAKDGASDEGPGYWNVGGGAMLDVFEIIRDATGSKIDPLTDPFGRSVAEYVCHANMYNDNYAGFADGSSINKYGYFLYHLANITKSDYLRSFALSKDSTKGCPNISITTVYRSLKFLFEYGDILNQEKTEFIHKDVWLPDSQHLYVRSSDNTVALSAKGGYNNESHNHNDLGSFIYMVNGESAIADLGGPRYTAKTFSPLRYDYWIVQSTAHNCAMINGFQEHNGDEYKSKEISHELTDERVLLSLDLKKAYEEEAGIRAYSRTFDFDKKTAMLNITDDILLEEETDNVDVHFLTYLPVEISNGKAIIKLQGDRKTVISVEGFEPVLENHFMITYDEEHYFNYDEKKGDAVRIVFKATKKSDHHIIRSVITTD